MPLAIDEYRYKNPLERLGLGRDILTLLTPEQAQAYATKFAKERLTQLHPDELLRHPKHPNNGGSTLEWDKLEAQLVKERQNLHQVLGEISNGDRFRHALKFYKPKKIDDQIREAATIQSDALTLHEKILKVQEQLVHDRTFRTPGTIYDGVPRRVILLDYASLINMGHFEDELHAEDLPTSFKDLISKPAALRLALRAITIDPRGAIVPEHGETEAAQVTPLVALDPSKPRLSTLAMVFKLSGAKIPEPNRLLPSGEPNEPRPVLLPFLTDGIGAAIFGELAPLLTTQWEKTSAERHSYLFSVRQNPILNDPRFSEEKISPEKRMKIEPTVFRVEGLILEIHELPKPPVSAVTIPPLVQSEKTEEQPISAKVSAKSRKRPEGPATKPEKKSAERRPRRSKKEE